MSVGNIILCSLHTMQWRRGVNISSTTNVNEAILQLFYIIYVYYASKPVYYEGNLRIYKCVCVYNLITLLSTYYYYYNSETLRYTDLITKRSTMSRLFSVKWETRVLINLLGTIICCRRDRKINKQSTIIKNQKNTVENPQWCR